VHAKALPGKPDILFPRPKVAVFVDGDFWHGRDWNTRRKKLSQGANANYWTRKISYNRKRDRENNEKLIRMGWLVVRLWETEVKKELAVCADCVWELVLARSGSTRNRQGPGYVYRLSDEKAAQDIPIDYIDEFLSNR
jgi:DNA mismatch endonuclease (patch repair protein)